MEIVKVALAKKIKRFVAIAPPFAWFAKSYGALATTGTA
jgi:hypothetical protein